MLQTRKEIYAEIIRNLAAYSSGWCVLTTEAVPQDSETEVWPDGSFDLDLAVSPSLLGVVRALVRNVVERSGGVVVQEIEREYAIHVRILISNRVAAWVDLVFDFRWHGIPFMSVDQFLEARKCCPSDAQAAYVFVRSALWGQPLKSNKLDFVRRHAGSSAFRDFIRDALGSTYAQWLGDRIRRDDWSDFPHVVHRTRLALVHQAVIPRQLPGIAAWNLRHLLKELRVIGHPIGMVVWIEAEADSSRTVESIVKAAKRLGLFRHVTAVPILNVRSDLSLARLAHLWNSRRGSSLTILVAYNKVVASCMYQYLVGASARFVLGKAELGGAEQWSLQAVLLGKHDRLNLCSRGGIDDIVQCILDMIVSIMG